MSLTKLGELGAHLQNCSMAKVPLARTPFSRLHLNVAFKLQQEGFISSIQKGSVTGPDIVPEEVTFDNISSRRLWLGLKYRNDKPVLKNFRLISKPSRRVHVQVKDLQHLANGANFRFVNGLQTGETMLVKTKDKQILTIHEALQEYLGGELLCRIS